MALPGSGVLTLADIQTEFGGTNPISLSEYYRGGGLVPDSSLNTSVPTSGVISVSDFYGASARLSLNYASTFSGTVVNGTSITIGTARGTRMVHIQGVAITVPTSGTIGGVTATFISAPSGLVGSVYGHWQAWAKVPTGTTATVTLNTGGGTSYVSTFDTVNASASTTSYQSQPPNQGQGPINFNFSGAVEDEGIAFWSFQRSFGGGVATLTLSSNSPGNVIYKYYNNNVPSYIGPGVALGYNITSTNDTRTFYGNSNGGFYKIGANNFTGAIFKSN
jgi:hypothetical protein